MFKASDHTSASKPLLSGVTSARWLIDIPKRAAKKLAPPVLDNAVTTPRGVTPSGSNPSTSPDRTSSIDLGCLLAGKSFRCKRTHITGTNSHVPIDRTSQPTPAPDSNNTVRIALAEMRSVDGHGALTDV